MVLEKTLENPLDCKEIQPVHPKGNQSLKFIGRLGAGTETPITWTTWCKELIHWKDPDAGQDWRQEKGTTEDELVGWHHILIGHEFEQAPVVGDGLGSLVCCSPWGGKESDMTEPNWYSNKNISKIKEEWRKQREGHRSRRKSIWKYLLIYWMPTI